MKPENKAFLEANRHHWITLRDAFYVRHLDGNTRSDMQRIMGEEFRPGYTSDLWCGVCVADMVRALYQEFEKWEAAQPVIEMAICVDTSGGPDMVAFAKHENGEVIHITEAEAMALAEKAKALEDAANKTTATPIPIKANFPSHKNRRR